MQWNLHDALVQCDAVVQWHRMVWVVSCTAPAVYIRFVCAALLCIAALQQQLSRSYLINGWNTTDGTSLADRTQLSVAYDPAGEGDGH